MNIDNRIFVVIASPFATITMLRVIVWFAGAQWSEPAMAAFAGVFVLGFACVWFAFCVTHDACNLGTTRLTLWRSE